jgi:hypothetical protein
MRFRLLFSTLWLLQGLLQALTASARAAAPVEVELATTSGVQITAPQQWLQLLTSLGIDDVRIRGANAGDQPQLENRGTDSQPRYHVVGILSAGEELQLPGGKFHAADKSKLKDYFARLAAEGAEGTTSSHGRFGLTEKQLATVTAELAQPIDFTTKDQPLRAALDRLQSKFTLRISPDADAAHMLRDATPIADEVKGLTAGTGLALALRSYGLALKPEKSVGEPVTYRVTPIAADTDLRDKPVGAKVQESWPAGIPTDKSPRDVSPVLMDSLNVEIDGYTLAEAIDVIGPRIKLPIYWDHYALAAAHIDPAAVKVSVPKTRTYYKRVLDRVLSQAHLAGQLRVDEAGTPFLWITR